ncbi:hypothetical protein AX17_002331 [Amanita inopinata Kibby_2008]|nr:hypothetical protein AX17_002331 [Amanita inopinata Kibby_2008]
MSRLGDTRHVRYNLDSRFTGLNVVGDLGAHLSTSPSPFPSCSRLEEDIYSAPQAGSSGLQAMSIRIVDERYSQASPIGEMAAGQPSPLESDPLLFGTRPERKPFYRARPLWLVPFAVTAALVRGMTLAPRVEVYTQLSCQKIYGHQPTLYNADYHQGEASVPGAFIPTEPPSLQPFPLSSLDTSMFMPVDYSRSLVSSADILVVGHDNNTRNDPLGAPSQRCISDPAVQSGAARLQTIMITTMGLLSALTTGWWGHFGERYGRRRVLAISTFGLFFTDLVFILVSIPSSPLSRHSVKFLLVAPVIEGLLGGYTTLQSATSAYVSDCTSPGSRARIFSQFAGVTYLGFAFGPSIGGWLIRNSSNGSAKHIDPGMGQSVTMVFWVAALCSSLNFILTAFLLPESLPQEKQQKARDDYRRVRGSNKGKVRAGDEVEGGTSSVDDMPVGMKDSGKSVSGRLHHLFSPLAIFLPVAMMDKRRMRMKTDWSLTVLAAALFGHYLSIGIFQLKYLYAEHTYGWGAEQLSYYISFLGGARALYLLFLLPSMIGTFNPRADQSGDASVRTVTTISQGLIVERIPPSTSRVVDPVTKTVKKKGKKGAPVTKSQLAKEITFDLSLAKLSFTIDILSNVLITLLPTPTYTAHVEGKLGMNKHSSRTGEMLFITASFLGSFGSGVVPPAQNLALCILQVREMNTAEGVQPEGGVGSLFGALATLQAIGSTILGPMLFGLVYSESVATFPKAVFALAGGILFIGFVLLMVVRNPAGTPHMGPGDRGKKDKGKRRPRRFIDVERGRSRVSKDLRGGAIPNYG